MISAVMGNTKRPIAHLFQNPRLLEVAVCADGKPVVYGGRA
jgi:hypothetical protein